MAYVEISPDDVGLPVALKPKKFVEVDPTKLAPDVLDAATKSKYPPIADPEQTIAGGIKDFLVPKNDTQAAIQIASFGLPFTKLLGDVPGVGGLMDEGITGIAKRIGLLTGVGAATGGVTGGVQGAKEGAETGALAGGLGEGGSAAAAPIGRWATGASRIEGDAVKTLAQTEAENVAKQAAEKRLGMTAEQAGALARPTGIGEESGAPALAASKKALSTTREDWRRAIGEKYNPIFEPVNKMPVHPERLNEIAAAADNAKQVAASRGQTLSPSTQKLLDGLSKSGEATDKLSGDVPDLIRGAKHIDPAAKARFTGLMKAWDDAHPEQAITSEDLRSIAIQALGGDTSTPTIQQLHGKLGQLQLEANRPGATAADRSALFAASQPMLETLNNAIPDAQKPALAAINAEYAQVNKIFPHKDLRAINQVGTLPELGKFAFGSNPEATTLAFQKMTPDQKELMRKSFASWMLSENTSSKDLFNALSKNKDNLKMLGFPDDFEKVETWRQLVGNASKMRDKPPDLMQLKQFSSAMRSRLRQEGVTPEILDRMDGEAQKAAAKGDMNSRYIKRMALLWGPMGMMAGYGWMYRDPEMLVPMAAYLGRQGLINNPAYRDFMLGSGGRWTRATGDAFARLVMSSPGFMDSVKEAAAPYIRPDNERREEAQP